MKKKIFFYFSTLLIILFLGGVFFIVKGPSTTTIAKEIYGIDLTNIPYKVEFEKEQWLPNGDGFRYVVLNFNTSSKEKLHQQFKLLGAKKLPISEQIYLNELDKQHVNIEEGFYKYSNEKDPRDFKILIFDDNKLKMILYNQVM